MHNDEEEVRMVVPNLVQSLGSRPLDLYHSSIEFVRIAIDKVSYLLVLVD
jgi:hypothetical protein